MGVDSEEAALIILSIRELASHGGASFTERCDNAVRERFPDNNVVMPKAADAWPASRNSPTKTYASSPHAPPPSPPSTGSPMMNGCGLFAMVVVLILAFGSRLVIPENRNRP